MVEQRVRPAVATFFCGEPMTAGHTVIVGDGEVQHARARRVGIGEPGLDAMGRLDPGDELHQLAEPDGRAEVGHVVAEARCHRFEAFPRSL